MRGHAAAASTSQVHLDRRSGLAKLILFLFSKSYAMVSHKRGYRGGIASLIPPDTSQRIVGVSTLVMPSPSIQMH